MRARWILTIFPPVALTLACAAPQEKVESAEAPAEDEAAAEAADQSAQDDTEEADNAEPDQRDGAPAVELLTATDVAFDFDFNNSAMKEKYQKQCEPSANDDPGKLAKCLQQKRQAFFSDVIWFRKDPETGDLLWLVYRRKGKTLSEVFRSPVVFEDEKHESVTVKISGPARGSRQIYGAAGKFTVSMPTKYALEIDDPKWGLLKYNSKLGLVQTGNSE